MSISVALILFEGGLDLPPRELRATGTVVRRLITIGAIVTFFVAFWGAEQFFDISRGAAAVLAAVLVVTGPTVVGPLLRFVRPNGRTGPMLRAEGILIDPIGATASLVAFEAALTDDTGEALSTILGVIGLTLVVGIGIGFLAAYVLDHALRRFLIPDHLGNPIALAFVIVAFVVSNEVQEEAGLLTVTVMGIWLARRDTRRGPTAARVQREPAHAADLGAVHPARGPDRDRSAARRRVAVAGVPRAARVRRPAALGDRVDRPQHVCRGGSACS